MPCDRAKSMAAGAQGLEETGVYRTGAVLSLTTLPHQYQDLSAMFGRQAFVAMMADELEQSLGTEAAALCLR